MKVESRETRLSSWHLLSASLSFVHEWLWLVQLRGSNHTRLIAMVRGNYQRRIEAAEARKSAAKQRKQRRDNRGTYKVSVLELFSNLDRHDLRSTATQMIHVWVDSAPADSPPILDMYQQDVGNKQSVKGGRGRKGRGRSNSMQDERKKAHPRSKEAEPAVEDSVDVPRLCRNHFFRGKCENIGKKGGCRNVHLPGRFMTLAQVVKSFPESKETLDLAEKAIDDQVNDGSDEQDGVDMLYYLSVPVDRTVSHESPLHIGELVSRKVSDESCGVASVVYLAIDNYLVFDRYRGGILISENDLQVFLHGNERRLRSFSSVFSEEGNDHAENDAEIQDHILLPAHVLEYILMFLPDEAVSTMSTVCEAWHEEIGQHSPELWRHLLARRDWPLPDGGETEGNNTFQRDIFRQCFIRHYSVVRDMEAVRLAAGAISSPSRKIVEENNMVFEQFSTRRSAPQEPNGCVAVRVWSPDQVLVAYSHDCTLRLFKTVARTADGGGSPRACREVVCVSVDPFRNTKRQRGRLVAMDLDGDYIGCLCHVMRDDRETEAYTLAVTRRDDFLCASGSCSQSGGASLEEGKLLFIDVGEAILNYLLSCDDVDHHMLRLFDFLSDGGDLSDVEVLVSQSIQACGYGRFMVEVAISIPSLELEDDDDGVIMVLVDRKLILFSAAAGAIVWMGSSNMTDEALPRQKEVTMASYRQVRPGERRATCSLAFVSSGSHMVLSAELDASGEMVNPVPIEASSVVRSELLHDNWQMNNVHRRPVAITSSDVVVVDSLFRDVEGEGDRKVFKSVVSFYPRFSHNISYSTCTLNGNCQAVRMQRTHDDYVVVLCRVIHETHTQAEDDIDGIDGHWFGDEDGTESTFRTFTEAMVIHVPSRREIHRICLLEEEGPALRNVDIPIFFTPNGSGSSTLGVGLWSKGIVMTGGAVRDVGRDPVAGGLDAAPRSAKKPKRKKRQQGKGGKKDGFARGMSLRG